jgi:hypothetical protein
MINIYDLFSIMAELLTITFNFGPAVCGATDIVNFVLRRPRPDQKTIYISLCKCQNTINAMNNSCFDILFTFNQRKMVEQKFEKSSAGSSGHRSKLHPTRSFRRETSGFLATETIYTLANSN